MQVGLRNERQKNVRASKKIGMKTFVVCKVSKVFESVLKQLTRDSFAFNRFIHAISVDIQKRCFVALTIHLSYY